MLAGMKLLICLMVMQSAGLVLAKPWYWAQGRAGNSPSCTTHPTLGPNPGLPHAAVTPDSRTSITLLGPDGKAVTTVCPGQKYAVLVKFDSPRLGLLSSTVGDFASYNPQVPPYDTLTTVLPCPNRVFIGIAAKVDTYQDGLEILCKTGANKEVVLHVTSGTDPRPANLQDTTATLPIDTSCAAPSCAAGGATTTPTTTTTDGTAAANIKGDTTTTATTPAPGPADPVPAVPSCTKSSLGYTCQQPVGGDGGVIVHYTVGSAHPNDSPCAPTSSPIKDSNPLPGGANEAGNGLLHMAVEATTNGWVGFGFTPNPGKMANTDIILGWVSAGGPYVKTFQSTGESLDDSNLKPWALVSGVTRIGDRLVVCFTRRVNEPQASNSQTLDVNNDININWAINHGSTALVKHDAQDGSKINLAKGTSSTVTSTLENKIRLHGALMAVAWALLLPLGTLLPRHRWVFGKAQCCGKDAWFPMHVGLQFTGMIIFTLSFIGAWIWFDVTDTIGKIHRLVGTIVFAFAWLQVVVAFFRPRPDHPRRGAFNLFHHWLGRIAVVAAWATIYLGIATYHQSIYQASYVTWLIPVFVLMLVICIIDIVLTIAARRRGWEVSSPRGKGGPKGGKNLNTVSMQPVLKNGNPVDLAVKTNPAAYKPMAARDSNIV